MQDQEIWQPSKSKCSLDLSFQMKESLIGLSLVFDLDSFLKNTTTALNAFHKHHSSSLLLHMFQVQLAP